jgi:rfaE bifunctional protein nucleotidyltransferase chain/domain
MPLENRKLFSLAQAQENRERLRANSRKFVLTNGAFDLLHPGHLFFLQEAARLGDLYVALNSDESVRELKGPSRPILKEMYRAYALSRLEDVKGVVIFRTKRLTEEIRKLKPDIYVKAGDYSLGKLDPGEREALEEVGAEIMFLEFLPTFSTSALIARIKAAGEI